MLSKIDFFGYNSMNLTHIWIHITMTAVKMQNHSITPKTSRVLSHFVHTLSQPITSGNH